MNMYLPDIQPEADEPRHRYTIGIDLGTTNSAVAFVDLSEPTDADGRRPIRIFEIPQLVAPADIAQRRMLPSFLYLPGAYDLPAGSTALPWDPEREYIVGEAAREQGARVPGRLVGSAKSWLSHAGVDRTAAILPWGAKAEAPRVSPVEASTRYLRHMREAWDARMAGGRPDDRFDRQQIILTVPASFDEVARELTVQAAHEAGISRPILLEEPLAAFYAWLAEHEADWQSRMRDGQLILVCDVGGGTSDFTLVGIREGEHGLRFDRLAVGEHLMLGGDNMDMTLARHLEARLAGAPGKLDTGRWHQLVHQSRAAKETLLRAQDAPPAVTVTVVGTGGSLIGGTLTGELTRDDVRRLILDGFFPGVTLAEAPGERRRAGLTELGLPYVQDPAVTRHLAAFWRRYEQFLRDETGREVVYPDWVLFNGGTLVPAPLRERLQHTIRDWFQPVAGADWTPIELENPHRELAVALGAAYYGLVRLGQGIRVGSGSPRTFYVAVDAEGGATADGLITAVCLVPRGTEEGFEASIHEPAFAALTNQPVTFRLFTSSTRLGDRTGTVVSVAPEEITALPPIRTILRFGKGVVKSLPVHLVVRLTTVGMLELWCQAQDSEHRWRLQFDLRADAGTVAPTSGVDETVDQAAVATAREAIWNTFGMATSSQPSPPEALRKTLEDTLSLSRERWPTMLIRQLADEFLACQEGRARSPEHEKRWLNLLGWCLRPGYGDPGDELRMQEVWRLYLRGLAFPKEPQCRSEWWIFWRRVAGGLAPAKQTQMYRQAWPYLQSGRTSKQKPSAMFPKHLKPGEDVEAWMTLASLEWLAPEAKIETGRRLLQQWRKKAPTPRELWALSRLGSRRLMYGTADRVVPGAEAAAWVETLTGMNLEPTEHGAHCLILLAQRTGDRGRDVPEETRERVVSWLARLPNADRFRELLLNPESTLHAQEQDWMLGDALPTGLVLADP